MTTDEKTKREEANANEAFEKFLQMTTTKFMLTMIPKAENEDVVRTLLRSAFDAGRGQGMASVIGDLITLAAKPNKS